MSWQTIAPLGVPRAHLNAAAVDGAVYAIGGVQPGALTGSTAVERYHAATGRWERVLDLPSGTDHAMVAVVASHVFVFGGNFASPSALAYRFDVAGGRWAERAPLPEPRAAGGAAVVGSRIYVIGGFGTERRLLATAWAYDTASDGWERIPDLPTPREHVAVVAFRGTVCALGGHFGLGDKTAVVECYDPSSRRWSSSAPLVRAASDFDAVAVADQVWAVGDDVQILEGDRWRLGPTLGTPRFGVAAAVVGRTIYVVGGSPRVVGSAGLVERLGVP